MERELFVEYAQCKKIQKFAKTWGGGGKRDYRIFDTVSVNTSLVGRMG